MLMPCRLPMPVAGIMPQSDPNAADAAAECDATGWLELAPAAEGAAGVELPQAAAVSVRAPASAPLRIARFIVVSSLQPFGADILAHCAGGVSQPSVLRPE